MFTTNPSVSWPRAAAMQGWSTAQIRLLRELALQGLPVSAIAARLRRSESAIRNKAGLHGISLRSASSHALEGTKAAPG